MNLALRTKDDTPSQADPSLALLPALDCLRVAVTLFDAQERLTYSAAHISITFSPPCPHAKHCWAKLMKT